LRGDTAKKEFKKKVSLSVKERRNGGTVVVVGLWLMAWKVNMNERGSLTYFGVTVIIPMM